LTQDTKTRRENYLKHLTNGLKVYLSAILLNLSIIRAE